MNERFSDQEIDIYIYANIVSSNREILQVSDSTPLKNEVIKWRHGIKRQTKEKVALEQMSKTDCIVIWLAIWITPAFKRRTNMHSAQFSYILLHIYEVIPCTHLRFKPCAIRTYNARFLGKHCNKMIGLKQTLTCYMCPSDMYWVMYIWYQIYSKYSTLGEQYFVKNIGRTRILSLTKVELKINEAPEVKEKGKHEACPVTPYCKYLHS